MTDPNSSRPVEPNPFGHDGSPLRSLRSVGGARRAGAGLHVVALLVALPVIGLLAAVMVWMMGGTAWGIVAAVGGSWLLVQGLYAAQIVLRYLKLHHAPANPRRERTVLETGRNGPGD